MKKTILAFFLISSLTLIFFTACPSNIDSSGGSETPGRSGNISTSKSSSSSSSAFLPNGGFENLAGAGTVSISKWNGYNNYTMITCQPSAKPESNSSASSTASYSLLTVGVAASMIENSISDSNDKNKFNSAMKRTYSAKQTSCDLVMRDAENQLLSKKTKMISKKYSGIDLSAPAPISEGTAWDNVYIAMTDVYINTTCQYVSNHAYFFVDNRDIDAMSTYLAGYGSVFDAIYDVNHNKFGSENDVDGNGKVIIIFSEELSGGLLGYFFAVDKFSKATYSISNEGDIFYMTTTPTYQGSILNGTLAHEFQHMIYFDQHYNKGVINTYTWLNEALSQAAEYYNGYIDNHLGWINSYLYGGYSTLSLTHWTQSNYGYGAIFIRYIIDRFGDTAIKNMCSNSTGKAGIAAIEEATGTDFNVLFNDFTKALVMSGTGDSNDPKYNFTTLNLQTVQTSERGGLLPQIIYSGPTTTPVQINNSIAPYSISFDKWTGKFGTLKLTGTEIVGTVFGLNR